MPGGRTVTCGTGWIGVVSALSCVPSAGPRFPTPIASAIAHDSMRKLDTADLELYYPENERDAALVLAARIEQCVERLRAVSSLGVPAGKVVAIATSANFNNAYVQPPQAGLPFHLVLPPQVTLEVFNWFNLGTNSVGDIACHEAVHYLQVGQTRGFWRIINYVGGNLVATNASLDPWFLEGLAVYYEGRLGRAVGRPNSALWHGMFESGFAERGGELRPGDLSSFNRDMVPFGAQYLVGSHFVDFLARAYGEDKLWQLVDLQGRAFLFPLRVSLRFKSVYGKTIGALLDEFSAEMRGKTRPRTRGAAQKVIEPNVGYLARLAASPFDGATAVIGVKRDEPAELVIRERDGSVRLARSLAEIVPPRRYIVADPEATSGMSFSRDGRWLYLVAADLNDAQQYTAKLWQIDAHTGDVERTWDGISGLGGSSSPDGRSYAYVEITPRGSSLVALDLATETRTVLVHFEGAESLAAPAYSPDGERIAFARRTAQGFDLWLRERSGGLVPLTEDGRFNYAPRWLDANRLLFLREHEGRAQAHVMDVTTRSIAPATDAPYAVLDPAPAGPDRIVFLNRDGWDWSLDEIATSPAEADSPADVASGPGSTLPADTQTVPEPPAVAVLSDTPYSGLDGLLAPTLHAPFALPILESNDETTELVGAVASLALSGGDRLGLHSYALNLQYDSRIGVSLAAAYGTALISPWFLQLTGARILGERVYPYSDDTSKHVRVIDQSLSLAAYRPIFTHLVAVSFEALERRVGAGRTAPPTRTHLLGPSLEATYLASESSAYGGTRRGLRLMAKGTYYPRSLGSDYDLGDVSASAFGFVPLPASSRHELELGVRGRALPGAPDRLLQVGGFLGGILVSREGWRAGESGPGLELPLGIAFEEPLRGYEDHALYAKQALIANARYRYPLIIDRGWTSLLYFFPPLFVREVGVEGFASGARIEDGPPRHHRAAGAALQVALAVWQVPFTVYYQFAARFDDRLRPLHLVVVSLGE